MTQEQKLVKDWMVAFGQECPEKPTIPDAKTRRLRAKLLLEEALETIEALGFTTSWNDPLRTLYEHSEPPCLEEILDGCEDLKVVTEGTLVACGLLNNPSNTGTHPSRLQDPHFNEVMRSNFSKLWTVEEVNNKKLLGDNTLQNICPGTPRPYLVKDKDGKVIKSPSYSPAVFNL